MEASVAQYISDLIGNFNTESRLFVNYHLHFIRKMNRNLNARNDIDDQVILSARLIVFVIFLFMSSLFWVC